MKVLHLALAASSSLLAPAAMATPVVSSQWAATYDNGGLRAGFVYLNSNGVNPLTIPDSWATDFSPLNAIYTATFDSGTYTNYPSWDGSNSIFPFGTPDTTSYGETFVAPSQTLLSFDFLISNVNVGDQATFVLASFNGARAETALFIEPVTVPTAGYTWVSSGPLNVGLVPGAQYIAFLTTADVITPVPEPASWATMLGGFCLAGFTLRRRRALSAARA